MKPDFALALLAAAIAAPASALAQTAQTAPSSTPPAVNLQDVNVVATTPLLGSGIDRDSLPQATQVLGAQDIDRTNIPSLTGAILSNIPSATINDVEGNVFQPDIIFRGFTASPTAGTPEGLAVYVNGARFNDPFGDTVNWDLIPSIAIQTVNVEASNPVFGLNALGGSVNVQLKNGFTYQGADLTAYGGSYGRGSGILEYGHQSGNLALYVAGEITHDDGFRQTSASDIYRLYTDLGWRSDAAELHLGITAADNTLGNPGATPTQALNANIANIFTAPNEVYNKYVSVNLNGNYALTDTMSLQGVAYFQNLTQRIPNGITTEIEPCDDGTDHICNDDGTPVIGRNGQPVQNLWGNGPYSGLSTQGLDAHYYGASAQLTDDDTLYGMKNHFVFGGSFDGSDSIFNGSTQIGGFNPYTREFVGPAVTQDQPSEETNPVQVVSTTRFYALFGQDILSLTPSLDLSVAGRFNDAETDLHDKLGGPVTGQHSYNRFDPSAGLTYHVAPWLSVYGSYSETNRVPTPQELSCASPATPCSLLSFFVGDPDLKQVVSQTFEIGGRGHLADVAGGKLSWDADYFHAKNHDDLIYETTVINPNFDFYTNAGKTLRQGVETSLHYDTHQLHVTLGYTYTDATFQTPLVLDGGANPAQNALGDLFVEPGDRIPGIPEHRGTVVAEYDVTPQWRVGGNAIFQSSAYRFGDEANLTKPVGGYGIVNLDTQYRITRNITVFGLVNNIFNKRYDTYGGFGPVGDVPWPNVPGGVTNPATASPGTPITGYGGIRVQF
jgi:outer membrane receptor protein involved in Fe transport